MACRSRKRRAGAQADLFDYLPGKMGSNVTRLNEFVQRIRQGHPDTAPSV
jgi:hypothetical protein